MDLLNCLQRNTNYYVYFAGIGGFSIALLWASGISFLLVACSLVASSLGYLLCHCLLQSPEQCCWLQLVIANFVYGQEALESWPWTEEETTTNSTEKQDNKTVETTKKKERNSIIIDDSNNRQASSPFAGLKLNARLNRELEEFFETLMEVYVNSWYHDKISEDASFVLEIRQLLRHSAAKLVRALADAPLHTILADQMLPLTVAHVERIASLLGESFPERIFENSLTPPSLLELKVFDQWPDPHWATLSPENQTNYLRSLADSLVCKFVDDIRIGGVFVDEERQKAGVPVATKWSCHSSRHFLRELVYSMLVPAIDFVSDPDSLNRLALSMLMNGGGDNKVAAAAPLDEIGIIPIKSQEEELLLMNISGDERKKAGEEENEEFLTKFCGNDYAAHGHAPDSLLSLKLSDLIRDPGLTLRFADYIRDLDGPINYLDCFLQARDIHMQIQQINNNQKQQSEHRSRKEEIALDAWQLFCTFVHPTAQNRIAFPATLVADFSRIVELKGSPTTLRPLEQVVEAVYQEVYQYLQYNFVIPFCQSENYLGLLCGAPPEAVELIRGESLEQARAHTNYKLPDASFSLSQFRKKLFNFILPSKDAQPTSANATFYHQQHHRHPSSASSTSDLERFPASSSATANFGSIDAGTAGVDFDDADITGGGGNIALADMGRDLAKWTVSIEGIEPQLQQLQQQQRRDNANTNVHHNFLFSIRVERHDMSSAAAADGDCLFFTSNRANEQASEKAEEDEAEPAKEAETGIDDLEEDDSSGRLPKRWTVRHSCEEFYALEQKLRAFYGPSLLRSASSSSSLPDKRSTLQLWRMGRASRALMDSHRAGFERFVQQMLVQPALKRSDLLCHFLTNDEDAGGIFQLEDVELNGGGTAMGGGGMNAAANNFLSDLNPIRAMQRKVAKERGQALKPFILNLLANVLAPPPPTSSNKSSAQQQQRQYAHSPLLDHHQTAVTTATRKFTVDETAVEERSISSGSADHQRKVLPTTSENNMPRKCFSIGSSTRGQHNDNSNCSSGIDLFYWKSHVYDIMLFLCTGLGLVRIPTWMEALLCSLRSFAGFLFSLIFHKKMEAMLQNHVLNVDMAICLVKSLHELVLSWNAQQQRPQSATPLSQMSETSSAAHLAVVGNTNESNALLQQQQRRLAQQQPQQMPTVSDQERHLRAELLLHCLEKRLVEQLLPGSQLLRWLLAKIADMGQQQQQKNHQNQAGSTTTSTTTVAASEATAVRRLFLCFQMPGLNRQLAYVLLDTLMRDVFLVNPQR